MQKTETRRDGGNSERHGEGSILKNSSYDVRMNSPSHQLREDIETNIRNAVGSDPDIHNELIDGARQDLLKLRELIDGNSNIDSLLNSQNEYVRFIVGCWVLDNKLAECRTAAIAQLKAMYDDNMLIKYVFRHHGIAYKPK